jgi:asparagine synthetase B (glutamine-hydrolysing)
VREALLPLPSDERLSDAWRKLAALWRRPDAFPHPYFFHRLLFTPGQSERLLRDPVAAALDAPWRRRLEASSLRVRGLDDFSAVSYLEQRSYLVNTLLRDADAMSMAHSLEVRVPYLDHNLVEFSFRERAFFRRVGDGPKALLRDILGRILPTEGHIRRKQPFHLPWGSWLKGPLGRTVAAGLSRLSPALRPYLSERETFGVWRSFERGRTNWSRPWSLFVLNEWVKKHLESPPAEAEEESLGSEYVHSGA